MISKELIKSEYKKWSEMYDIPFEKEFEVKALIELQCQYYATPNDHIRTKTDILNAIHNLKRNLGLKKKEIIHHEDKMRVLVIVDNYTYIKPNTDWFVKLVGEERILNLSESQSQATIVTDNTIIEIRVNSENVRGLKYDRLINLCKDKTLKQ